jgi:hypothetical protein
MAGKRNQGYNLTIPDTLKLFIILIKGILIHN